MILTVVLTKEEVEFLEGVAGRRKFAIAWALHQVLDAQITSAQVAGVSPELEEVE